jgi:hypothetical protein
MRRCRGRDPQLQRTGAALASFVIRGHSATTLTATVAISVLLLVLLIAVIALGASFSRSMARRRDCLRVLETLLRLAPWTDKR